MKTTEIYKPGYCCSKHRWRHWYLAHDTTEHRRQGPPSYSRNTAHANTLPRSYGLEANACRV